jgi:hypothetical protein
MRIDQKRSFNVSMHVTLELLVKYPSVNYGLANNGCLCKLHCMTDNSTETEMKGDNAITCNDQINLSG